MIIRIWDMDMVPAYLDGWYVLFGVNGVLGILVSGLFIIGMRHCLYGVAFALLLRVKYLELLGNN